MNKSVWQRWFLVGWAVVLGVLFGYEVFGWIANTVGVYAYPTLSEIIVTLVGWKVASIATIIIAGVLCWHWWTLEKAIDEQE